LEVYIFLQASTVFSLDTNEIGFSFKLKKNSLENVLTFLLLDGMGNPFEVLNDDD
jgi:hypothetical protein